MSRSCERLSTPWSVCSKLRKLRCWNFTNVDQRASAWCVLLRSNTARVIGLRAQRWSVYLAQQTSRAAQRYGWRSIADLPRSAEFNHASGCIRMQKQRSKGCCAALVARLRLLALQMNLRAKFVQLP